MIFALLLALIISFGSSLEQVSQNITSCNYYANEACKFDVSRIPPVVFSKIAEVLKQPCTDPDRYEITLLDQEHVELLEISQNSSILIMSKNIDPTVWFSDDPYGFTIYLEYGNLTVENIKFFFTTLGDDDFLACAMGMELDQIILLEFL
ncbi:MAG: hypothetical protein EZS28_016589 [Streblomastix strix]|uniref:Uncharacterized protein n=1 Tax=Streblomastix strix TaxID=222440 RepID=A0A5J4W057_9EUKA|nr:MAG: hypothetical protein EZS28_016589 [Streblomastix strix]